jgi:hypothetical protein
VFDHLNFRDKMQQAKNRPEVFRLEKPTAISGGSTVVREVQQARRTA